MILKILFSQVVKVDVNWFFISTAVGKNTVQNQKNQCRKFQYLDIFKALPGFKASVILYYQNTSNV